MKKERYNVLDLFCGAGGLSRGFIDAGFAVKLGVDFDDMALKTFANNHEGAVAMKLDLFDLSNVDKIKAFFDEKKIFSRRACWRSTLSGLFPSRTASNR